MAKRMPAAYRAVMEMAAVRRAERNLTLYGPRGLREINRCELRRDDVVYATATLQPLYVVEHVAPAVAKHYMVVIGRDMSGADYRTSGHVLDDVVVKRFEGEDSVDRAARALNVQ